MNATVEHITTSPHTRKVQDSYAVTLNGAEIATAHQVGTHWSVVVGGKPIGLAPSREIAIKHLVKVAAVANKGA